jgi:cytochrome c oxidase subunit 2
MSMPRVRPPRVAFVLALLLVAVVASGCQAIQGMYPPQAVTEQGTSIRNLYDIVFGIAVVIFLLVEGLIIYAVIRYRRKPTDTELPPQIHGNNALEIIWTVIPMLIVGFLFFVSWQTLNTVDAKSPDPGVNIRAVAARFQWTFDYLAPDGSTVLFTQLSPEMDVPAGKTVHLTIVSKDVNHSFYVPQFLFKRDAIPGRVNSFDFKVEATDAGQTFRGQCAELCGTYHASMLFTVKALTPAEYDTWVQQQTAAAQATPAPSPSSSGDAAAGATRIDLAAKDIAFQQTTLTAPADKPFTIQFQNDDAGVPHNVVIHAGTSITDPPLFDGEVFSGVDSRLYPIPALKAGTYLYSCKVHPNMTGILTVQ